MASTKEILQMDLYGLLGIEGTATEKEVQLNVRYEWWIKSRVSELASKCPDRLVFLMGLTKGNKWNTVTVN